MRPPFSRDTPPEIERLQIQGWRRMSSGEKAAAVSALTSVVLEMARAGIRHRHPCESPRAHLSRLAEVLHGPEIAGQLFPELLESRDRSS